MKEFVLFPPPLPSQTWRTDQSSQQEEREREKKSQHWSLLIATIRLRHAWLIYLVFLFLSIRGFLSQTVNLFIVLVWWWWTARRKTTTNWLAYLTKELETASVASIIVFSFLLSSVSNVEEGHRRQQMIASVSFSRCRAFANTMMKKKKKKKKRERSALLFSTTVCVHREIIMRTRSVPMSFVLSLSFFGSIAELQ